MDVTRRMFLGGATALVASPLFGGGKGNSGAPYETADGFATDPVMVRRLYLELAGRLPTADEAKAYVRASGPDKKAKLEVITARGVVKTVTGTRIEWDVPKETWGCGWDGAILDVFCRVKAYAPDGSKEVLFTQPYMLKCGAWRA